MKIDKSRMNMFIASIILIALSFYFSGEWQCWFKDYTCGFSPIGDFAYGHSYLGFGGVSDILAFFGAGFLVFSTLFWNWLNGGKNADK